jgi:hypothetical protein
MVHYQGKELIKGRPPGSKNKLTREFHEAYEEAKSRGYTHPYLRMMEIANDPNTSEERRDAFLKECASYACPKAGVIQHQLVSEVQQPTSIEHAEDILAQLFAELAPELDPIQLATMLKAWIESKRSGAELDLKLNPKEQRPITLRIEGGLPVMPGHEDLIMPGDKRSVTNGHGTAQIESSGNESSPQPPTPDETNGQET